MDINEYIQAKIQKRLKEFKPEHQAAVFADFDKMVAHLARTHGLYQDEVVLLMACWFNTQPCCLKTNVTETKEE